MGSNSFKGINMGKGQFSHIVSEYRHRYLNSWYCQKLKPVKTDRLLTLLRLMRLNGFYSASDSQSISIYARRRHFRWVFSVFVSVWTFHCLYKWDGERGKESERSKANVWQWHLLKALSPQQKVSLYKRRKPGSQLKTQHKDTKTDMRQGAEQLIHVNKWAKHTNT